MLPEWEVQLLLARIHPAGLDDLVGGTDPDPFATPPTFP